MDDTAEHRAWPAGWYGDPWFPGQQRYWDGTAWTPHVHAGATSGATRAEPSSAEAAGWAGGAASQGASGAWSATGTAGTTGWSSDTTTDWGASTDAYAPAWASSTGNGGGEGWLRPPPAPATSRRPARWLALGVIAVVVAVAAAAITVASGSGRPKHVAAQQPGSFNVPNAPATTIPPASSTDPNASLLNRLDVTQADAPAGTAVALLQGGNLVTGQVTLDLCNGTFASESRRTARRQVDLDDQTGRTLLSTEAVLYTSPAATQQAFSELKARATNCPQGFLNPPPGEDGLPPSKTTFSAAPDGSWANVAGVDRLAYAFTTTTQDGTSDNSIAVYLRHGRALLGLYFSNPATSMPAIAGKTTVAGIVGVFEQRLAQLPASAVNATVPAPPPSGGI